MNRIEKKAFSEEIEVQNLKNRSKSVSSKKLYCKSESKLKANTESFEEERNQDLETERNQNFQAENENLKTNRFFDVVQNDSVADIIFANLIMLTAIFGVSFIPFFSITLPIFFMFYFKVGVYGYVLKKQKGEVCKFEEIFVSVKKTIKIFCTAVVKVFLILFWLIWFIVPGAICMLDLSFTNLILAETDDLDVKGILMLSKELTKGYRWNIFFYFMLAVCSVCVAMTFMFSIILLFDLFLIVPNWFYILFVVLAGILDIVLLAIPMLQIAITDCYIKAKTTKMKK